MLPLAALPVWFWSVVWTIVCGIGLWWAIALFKVPEPAAGILRGLMVIAVVVWIWVRFV